MLACVHFTPLCLLKCICLQDTTEVFQGEEPQGLRKFEGSDNDVGRWVLMPIACYPNLESKKKKNKTHIGWAVKITKFNPKSAHPYELTEHEQSGTFFSKEDFFKMSVLSGR